MSDDKSRRTYLLDLIDNAIEVYARWADLSDPPHVTAGVDQAMVDLIEGWAEGGIPAGCRELEPLVAAFGKAWRQWQREADVHGALQTLPEDPVWKPWEALCTCYRGVMAPPPKTVESIPTLVRQLERNYDNQICDIYGWYDASGRPETWKIDEELAEPGKHTKDWVPPAEKKRQEELQAAEERAARLKRLREHKMARAMQKCPETLEDLIRQNVYLHQTADMLGLSEQQVLEACDEKGLPYPPEAPSVHALRGRTAPDETGAERRQGEALAAERERLASEDSPVALDEGLTLEQQIVELHEQGLSDQEIALRVSMPDAPVSRQKVQAVLQRFERDPEAVVSPSG